MQLSLSAFKFGLALDSRLDPGKATSSRVSSAGSSTSGAGSTTRAAGGRQGCRSTPKHLQDQRFPARHSKSGPDKSERVVGGRRRRWQAQPRQILWLQYEELKRDPPAAVAKIARFLGCVVAGADYCRWRFTDRGHERARRRGRLRAQRCPRDTAGARDAALAGSHSLDRAAVAASDWHSRRKGCDTIRLTKIAQGWPRLWANFTALVGTFNQNAGPSLAIWAFVHGCDLATMYNFR